MKKRDLEIVFFHELGHFIAHELNYELYGNGKVGALEFVEYPLANGIQYQGKTVPFVGEDQNKDEKLKNLPEKIAELVYGCYFQALYTELPLRECLDIYNENSKGYFDAQNIASGLMQFHINSERKILYPYLHDEYFEMLNQQKCDFDLLFKIDFQQYLIRTDFGYKADLVKLYEKTAEFRKLHKSNFQKFVERIKEIINWKKTCANNV